PSALQPDTIMHVSSYSFLLASLMETFQAVKGNHLEVVQFLLSETKTDPTTRWGDIFSAACEGGYREIAFELLQRREFSPMFGFRRACSCGQIELVKKLIELNDPRIVPDDWTLEG